LAVTVRDWLPQTAACGNAPYRLNFGSAKNRVGCLASLNHHNGARRQRYDAIDRAADDSIIERRMSAEAGNEQIETALFREFDNR
jgi:hypothetical protein